MGRKECTPALFDAPLIKLWAGKSVPPHSLLPEYSRQERAGKSVPPHSLLPHSIQTGQERVYPYILFCQLEWAWLSKWCNLSLFSRHCDFYKAVTEEKPGMKRVASEPRNVQRRSKPRARVCHN